MYGNVVIHASIDLTGGHGGHAQARIGPDLLVRRQERDNGHTAGALRSDRECVADSLGGEGER